MFEAMFPWLLLAGFCGAVMLLVRRLGAAKAAAQESAKAAWAESATSLRKAAQAVTPARLDMLAALAERATAVCSENAADWVRRDLRTLREAASRLETADAELSVIRPKDGGRSRSEYHRMRVDALKLQYQAWQVQRLSTDFERTMLLLLSDAEQADEAQRAFEDALAAAQVAWAEAVSAGCNTADVQTWLAGAEINRRVAVREREAGRLAAVMLECRSGKEKADWAAQRARDALTTAVSAKRARGVTEAGGAD